MNSRSFSINLLTAVVALIVVCNALRVSPPARLAGRDHKSTVGYINFIGGKSRNASRRENATQVRNTPLVCCGPPDAIVEKSVNQTCSECKHLCETVGMNVKCGGSWLIKHCRCYKTKSCPYIRYERQVTFDDGDTERTQNNYIDSSSSTRYGSFATAAAYKTIFYRTSMVSCISMCVTAVLYVFIIGNNQYSTYAEHLMMSVTLLIYMNAVTQFQRRPTIDDFQLSGM